MRGEILFSTMRPSRLTVFNIITRPLRQAREYVRVRKLIHMYKCIHEYAFIYLKMRIRFTFYYARTNLRANEDRK